VIRPGREARRAAGRLCLVDFSGTDPSIRIERLIVEDRISGVVLFRKNVASASQVAALTAALRRIARHAYRQARVPPVWVAIDHEGGAVNRFAPSAHDPAPAGAGAMAAITPLPSAMSLGAAGDPALARLAGCVAGRELRAMGVNLNFAPVLDINSNPANPVIGARAFGESPALVEGMGLAYLDGLQSAGVGAAAKHFPGHGDVTVDSHLALPRVEHGADRLEAVEMAPFAAAVRAGVAAVMTAHVAFPGLDPAGVPATMSRPILRGILRERWGYRGLICSDSLSMRAIVDHHRVGDAAVAAVLAGCDLLLALGPDALQDEALEHLALAIEHGDIPADRLAETMRRLDEAAGRWGSDAAPPRGLADVVGSPEHAAIARRIAEAAVTLVRDRAGMIPLKAARVDVVTVPAASGDDTPLRFAPWLCRYHPAVTEIAADDLARDDPAGGNDTVIAVMCTRGMPAPSQVALIRHLYRRLRDRLIVLAAGDPYDLLQFPEVPAYLVTYGPDGPSLDAAARILVGLVRPRGRLPVTLPGLYHAGEASPTEA
jgi:beta-N-acetylhexosaminidase